MAESPRPADFDNEFDDAPRADDYAEDLPEEPARPPPPAQPAQPAQPAAPVTVTETAQNVAASTVAATTAAASAVTEFTKSNTGMTVAILVIGVVVAFVIAYIIYWFIDYTINDRSKYMLKATRMPIICTQVTTLNDANKIPQATNGKRMSVAFWMYIYDINKNMGSDRHVFHRGQYDRSKEDTACPYVVLDKNMNKLHVTFPPREAEDLHKYNGQTIIASESGVTEDTKKIFYRTVRGITIDYVPLQRWVHIAVVANEEVNGGILTAYVDGELVKNVSSNTRTTTTIDVGGTKYNIGLDLTRAGLDTGTGPVFVGGTPTAGTGPGFSGMVSKITFFNYDLNAKDVYNNYLNGPIDSLLAKMGLPAYGLQSPIYRVG
jgi:hypothetical protein